MRCASAGGDPKAIDATLEQIFKKTLARSPVRNREDRFKMAKANGQMTRLDIEKLGKDSPRIHVENYQSKNSNHMNFDSLKTKSSIIQSKDRTLDSHRLKITLTD